jgi:amino acid permease
LTPGLTDGGTAGLIWGFVLVAVGFFFVFASLSEMASMYAVTSKWLESTS